MNELTGRDVKRPATGMAQPLRFGQISLATPKFVEQPRILDGDDGRRRKIIHQLDLLIGKRTNFFTGQDDGTD